MLTRFFIVLVLVGIPCHIRADIDKVLDLPARLLAPEKVCMREAFNEYWISLKDGSGMNGTKQENEKESMVQFKRIVLVMQSRNIEVCPPKFRSAWLSLIESIQEGAAGNFDQAAALQERPLKEIFSVLIENGFKFKSDNTVYFEDF